MEYEENADLHAEEAQKVDEALFQPPYCFRWISIITRFDRFGRSGERGQRESIREDLKAADEYWYSEGSLDLRLAIYTLTRS